MKLQEHIVREYKGDALSWKRKVGYSSRAVAENFFSVFKRLFGETVLGGKDIQGNKAYAFLL